MNLGDLIYLDYHATTPCDPRVVQVMLPYFGEVYGNPSSIIHTAGRAAASAVERAREQVASLIGARRGEIIFTSGATESNNLAIAGVARAASNGRRRIVTTVIEHKSVLMLGRELTRQGFDIVELPLDSEGRVSMAEAREAINSDTLLVSVQAASNEIGTIQEIGEIAELAHERGALMHTDAAQAVGKIPVDLREWGVDFLSLSSHKLYGPKGVGALYIQGGAYQYPVSPLVYGGGQEWSLRSGTLNVPGIVGLGAACALCSEELPTEAAGVRALRDRFEELLLKAVPGISRNGAVDWRLPGNSSLTFPGLDAEAILANSPQLALSTGSACTSGAPEPSYVLLAIGLSREQAYSTIRVGLGRFTTEGEVIQATSVIAQAAERLRAMQPSLR
jgi:cysteine desulfurase